MAISLGGLDLNPNLIWIDQYNYSPINHVEERTLDGHLFINTSENISGKPITLESTIDQGWFTYQMINTLGNMSRNINGIYSLIINDFNASVMFRHSDKPALNVIPLIPRLVYKVDDYFYGTIKLITI